MNTNIIVAAKEYIKRGYQPIPIRARSKQPVHDNWQSLRITPEKVPEHFKQGKNIGLLLGEPSGWLVDIDCDCPYARQLAPQFLPPTRMVSGHRSAPASHYWYIAKGARTRKFSLPPTKEKKETYMIIEVRANGQTLVPPSIHPSGEQYEWVSTPLPPPTEIEAEELFKSAARLAAAAALANIWSEGQRHEIALCLAGALAYSNWREQEAIHFILAIAEAAQDSEIEDRRRAISDTFNAVRTGKPATGFPTLTEIIGESVAKRVSEWLNLRQSQQPQQPAQPTSDTTGAHKTQPPDQQKKHEAACWRLVRAIKNETVELFLSQDGEPHITLRLNKHFETHAIQSKVFENLLAAFCNDLEIVPRPSTISEALAILRGEAQLSGRTRSVCLRVGGSPSEAIYLDLGHPDWKIVEATPTGWRLIPYEDCPIRFYRSRYALPIPAPMDGSISALRPFLRTSEADFLLICAWLIMALRPDAPYPILAIRGEQGSGKSMATRLLRDLIDPRAPAYSGEPSNPDDLLIRAKHSHLVAFDNLSKIPSWLSDGLCRLATGAGLEKRALYTDADEYALSARRPVIINSIREIVERPDLADRVVWVELQHIDGKERLEEREILQAWSLARAPILGALLAGVCRAMRDFDSVLLPEKPRMADFASWAVAGVQAWGYTAELFLDAYAMSRSALSDQISERDVLASLLLRFLEKREGWEGTAATLLKELQIQADEIEKPLLPKDARGLGNRLNELEPILRENGIGIERIRKKQSRIIRFQQILDLS